MPRYYFDVTDSLNEARQLCHTLLLDVAREERHYGDAHTVLCDVRDEAGRRVYRGASKYEGTRDP